MLQRGRTESLTYHSINSSFSERQKIERYVSRTILVQGRGVQYVRCYHSIIRLQRSFELKSAFWLCTLRQKSWLLVTVPLVHVDIRHPNVVRCGDALDSE